MWNINNIFDLYQTVYNTSINNGTISKRSISSNDIVIIIILSLLCLMIFICTTKILIRRYRKTKERNGLRFSKDPISKIIQVEKNIVETPSQSDSIQ